MVQTYTAGSAITVKVTLTDDESNLFDLTGSVIMVIKSPCGIVMDTVTLTEDSEGVFKGFVQTEDDWEFGPYFGIVTIVDTTTSPDATVKVGQTIFILEEAS